MCLLCIPASACHKVASHHYPLPLRTSPSLLADTRWGSMCSRTLQPHLFIFTAVGVKAGQEVLLDYGEVNKSLSRPSSVLQRLLACKASRTCRMLCSSV